MECLWGNTSIIIPKHEERAFCRREGGGKKSATATKETRRRRGAGC
jgi:hypothetical protein